MNPDGPTIRAQLDAELRANGKIVSPDLLDGMTTLLVGILRRSIPPSPELEPVWQDQCIGWMVTGMTRVPHPQETADLPGNKGMLRSLFQQAGEPVPSDEVVTMLADIASFAIYRQMEPTPGFVVGAVNLIGECFRDGRHPPWF
jgi:hypothetical protein